MAAAWAALLAGRTGAAPITRFDFSGFQVRFACEVKGFDASDYLQPRSVRRMDRCAHLAVAAAREAERDAGLDVRAVGARAGTAIGSALGGVESFEQTVLQLDRRGPERVSPFWILRGHTDLAAGWVSIELGSRGPLLSQSTACAASNMAIGDGFDAIRLGRAEVMVCGGAEAPVTPSAVAAFSAMRALSRRNDDPASASRPFDAERDSSSWPRRAPSWCSRSSGTPVRDARIYGEVCGYGVSSDANHVSDPDPVGTNAARAIEMALAEARILPGEVGYVNAHGTSTPVGDAAETRVLKIAFGDHARDLAISSTKGATGHTLGAAGAVEATFTVLALHAGVLPPTVNQMVADPECDLDYLANNARAEQVAVAISNSFGFGGHNSVLVFRRWTD